MGLYDDDKAAVTEGDINDRDYWQARFDLMMLDLALKQRQPEGRIGLNLVSTVRNLDELTKKYPNHAALKAWKAKAESVASKVDPNAGRGEPWKPGCPWDEANFAQMWINFNAAKSARDAKETELAYGYISNVVYNSQFLLRPDRLRDYPDDLRAWVHDIQPDANKLHAELKEATHR